MEALVAKISKLEYEAAQFASQRLEPLGLDRLWRRYWLLPAAALGGGARDAVLVERPRRDPGVDGPPGGFADGGAGAGPAWEVGVYRTAAELAALLAWVNPKGARERGLAEALQRLAAHAAQQEADAAKASEAAAQVDQAADGAAEAEPAAEPAAPAEPPAAPLERLRAALLEFAAGFSDNMLDAVHGGAERMARWEAFVRRAAAPRQLMAAAVEIEHAIAPDFLKPHWRPWAWPAPAPAEARTLAAVWLRLDALKSAVRLRVTIKFPRGGAAGAAARYPLRGAAPGEAEAGARRGAKRAESAEPADAALGGKRARRWGAEEPAAPADADEALARRLQEELNAGGRATRGRLRGVFEGTDEGGARGGDGLYRGALRAGGTRRSYRAGASDEEDEPEEMDSGNESEAPSEEEPSDGGASDE
jgi:hypothetical protein